MTAQPAIRAARSPEAAGPVLAIASGKGGVGKTWLSITLAHALAQTGRRTLLVDGDLGLANVDVQIGLGPARDMAAMLAGRATLEESITAVEVTGFDLLAGRSGSGSLSSLGAEQIGRLMSAIGEARKTWELVLIDLGAGLDPVVRRLASAADTVLVVTTEEPTALTDAYALVKLVLADRKDADLRIVVNQASSRTAGERTHEALARATERFLGYSPPLAGVIRRDERVVEAIRRQAPLLSRHPNSEAAVGVVKLVETLNLA